MMRAGLQLQFRLSVCWPSRDEIQQKVKCEGKITKNRAKMSTFANYLI